MRKFLFITLLVPASGKFKGRGFTDGKGNTTDYAIFTGITDNCPAIIKHKALKKMKANGDNKINTLGKLPFPKKIFSYFYFKFQQNTVL